MNLTQISIESQIFTNGANDAGEVIKVPTSILNTLIGENDIIGVNRRFRPRMV